MMQSVGRRYVRAFNERHACTGTLWEGHYKSCLVEGDGYFITCLRYIELNPVRAGMVIQPWDHHWSSVHFHLGLRAEPLVTPHPLYLAIGYESTRTGAYRTLLLESLQAEVLAGIRDHIRQERALGSSVFQAMVAKTLNRPATVRPIGRSPVLRDSNTNVL